jgi:Asp/Glu/hydantoin racemase
MSIRIWHQSMAELDTLPAYRQALEAHLPRVLPPESGTQVVLHGMPPGTYPPGAAPIDVLVHPYAYHLTMNRVLENVVQAERQGFDAVALGSYSEPLLREARSIVSIPVASMAEATLLVGCSVARYLAIVTVSAEVARMTERLVAGHGLQGRVRGVYVLDPPVNEHAIARAFDAPAPLLASFLQTARRGVAEGADVVIPAEGVFNEVLFAQGVARLDDVPVMDCVGVTFLYAELLVQLRRRTGLEVGRRWEYARPGAAVIAHVRQQAGLPP